MLEILKTGRLYQILIFWHWGWSTEERRAIAWTNFPRDLSSSGLPFRCFSPAGKWFCHNKKSSFGPWVNPSFLLYPPHSSYTQLLTLFTLNIFLLQHGGQPTEGRKCKEVRWILKPNLHGLFPSQSRRVCRDQTWILKHQTIQVNADIKKGQISPSVATGHSVALRGS